MNQFIGEPNEVLKSYTKSKKRRTISDMTTDECEFILNIANDREDWHQASICNVKIESAYDNFVEGVGCFSKNSLKPFEFAIRYDGTVEIFRTIRDEDTNKTIKIEKLYVSNFTNIVLVMMKMNFDVTKHLEKTI